LETSPALFLVLLQSALTSSEAAKNAAHSPSYSLPHKKMTLAAALLGFGGLPILHDKVEEVSRSKGHIKN
jgi:hypothetical protein